MTTRKKYQRVWGTPAPKVVSLPARPALVQGISYCLAIILHTAKDLKSGEYRPARRMTIGRITELVDGGRIEAVEIGELGATNGLDRYEVRRSRYGAPVLQAHPIRETRQLAAERLFGHTFHSLVALSHAMELAAAEIGAAEIGAD